MTQQHEAPPALDPKAQAAADKAYRKAQRPWFKKKRFILPLALVVLIVIAQIGGGGDSDPASQETKPASSEPATDGSKPAAAEPAEPAEPAEAGIGTAVRDGKFEFTVTRVERPGNKVGEGILEETAQGEFVIVYVNVANIGDKGQMLDSTSQTLIDGQAREFNPSSAAMFTLPNADKAFLENINPGNSVTDVPILFDVAPGTGLDKIELHDSLFSGGVTVKLT